MEPYIFVVINWTFSEMKPSSTALYRPELSQVGIKTDLFEEKNRPKSDPKWQKGMLKQTQLEAVLMEWGFQNWFGFGSTFKTELWLNFLNLSLVIFCLFFELLTYFIRRMVKNQQQQKSVLFGHHSEDFSWEVTLHTGELNCKNSRQLLEFLEN